MTITVESIKKNYDEVLERIADAQARSHYAAKEVRVTAVSKTHPAEVVDMAYEAGLQAFGENKVQEFNEKVDVVKSPVYWHMIGHMQTNKVRFAAEKIAMIESLDRVELAMEIEKRAAALNRIIPCLLQVNILNDPTKYGMSEGEVVEMCRIITNYPHIQVCGLMGIAPLTDDKDVIRKCFSKLRQLRDSTAEKAYYFQFHNVVMDELSMGMSGDYEIAVEEGATMIRVGSALFGERIYR